MFRLFVILQISDLITTFIGIQWLGLHEIGPVVGFFMYYLGWFGVAFIKAISIFVGYVLYKHARPIYLVVLNLAGIFVISLNLSLIFGKLIL